MARTQSVSDADMRTGMCLVRWATIMTILSGCGTTRLSNEVKPFVGRDFHELTARLGNPTGKRETTGNRVYVLTCRFLSDQISPKKWLLLG